MAWKQFKAKHKQQIRFVFYAVSTGLLISAVVLGLSLMIGTGGRAATAGSGTEIRDEAGETAAPAPAEDVKASSADEQPLQPAEKVVQMSRSDANWSDWCDALPSGVTPDGYTIQTRTLYSSRQRQTMETQQEMTRDGWELCSVSEKDGDFGPWSEWTQTKPASSESREVESKTQYRCRELEQATGSSPSMDGWTLQRTTYGRGEYGDWSDWSRTPISETDSRKVESRTRYRYRDRETTAALSPDLDGWTLCDTSAAWGEYGDWSPWSAASMRESDSRQVQQKQQYKYGIYVSDLSYADGSTFFGTYPYEPNRSYAYYETYWLDEQLPAVWDSEFGCYKYGPYGSYEDFSYWYLVDTQTVYRCRDRSQSMTYYFSRWGNWSEWCDTPFRQTDDRQVESAVFYRSSECLPAATYHFTRWTDWSEWTEATISASATRQMEKAVFYRSRDRQTQKTYLYEGWSEWSEYTTQKIKQTKDLEVRELLQYRYCAG